MPSKLGEWVWVVEIWLCRDPQSVAASKIAPLREINLGFFCNLAEEVVEPIEVDSTGIYDLQTNQTTFFKEQVLFSVWAFTYDRPAFNTENSTFDNLNI